MYGIVDAGTIAGSPFLQSCLDDEKGVHLLGNMIGRAESTLWIRETKLHPYAWENKEIIAVISNFLKKDKSELKIAIHKSDDKANVLVQMQDKNASLINLLKEEENIEKISKGEISLYWWATGYIEKHHLVISERDVCMEVHYSGSEHRCGVADFFLDDKFEVERCKEAYKASMSGIHENDKFEIFASRDLIQFLQNISKEEDVSRKQSLGDYRPAQVSFRSKTSS